MGLERISFPIEFGHQFRPGWHSGSCVFVQKAELHDPMHGFFDNGWFTFVVSIWPEDDIGQSPAVSERDGLENKCVFCLDSDQTSGFVHGETCVSF